MKLDAIEEQIRVEISHSVFIRGITMWERTPHEHIDLREYHKSITLSAHILHML